MTLRACAAADGRRLVLRLALALSILGTAAAHAAPLAGRFSSPLGPLTIREGKDGGVTGTITDPKNVCAFKKGKAVLNGARLNDSLAATFTACRLKSETCRDGDVAGDAILLVMDEGRVLSGVVHFSANPGCKNLLQNDALTLRKGKPSSAPLLATPKNQSRAEALVKEALTFIHEKQADRAQTKCREAQGLDPNSSQAYDCLGVTFYMQRKYAEALAQYNLALKADPANHDVYYNVACVHAVQNRIDEAIQFLKLALLNGYISLETLLSDPDLENLRGNPAFERLKSGEFD